MLPALITALVLAHGAGWHQVSVTKHRGATAATLSYSARPANVTDLRAVRLVVRLHGRTVIDRMLRTWHQGTPTLSLRDVWGEPSPEALVGVEACGNRCSFELFIGLPARGRVVSHDFEIQFSPITFQRRDGTVDMIGRDGRFFCEFADCASSTTPVQALAVGRAGNGIVDVSRTRRDLLVRDARSMWKGYLQERKSKLYQPLGTLVPYCADEYRLGVTAYCDRVLKPAVKRQLTAWGYR